MSCVNVPDLSDCLYKIFSVTNVITRCIVSGFVSVLFVSDIAVFVLKRDVKLQPTNLVTALFATFVTLAAIMF